MAKFVLAVALALAMTTYAAEPLIVKIAALSSGQLQLNGKPTDLKKLDVALADLKNKNGQVWYYRENARVEPHPNAMAAIQLIVKYRLPMSMSTKADFSDYVDVEGRSRPRNP